MYVLSNKISDITFAYKRFFNLKLFIYNISFLGMFVYLKMNGYEIL